MVTKLSRSLLESKNIFVTKPRLFLLEILLKEKRPLSVDQLIKLSKGKLALSSIYRVINDLRDFDLLEEFQNPENIKVVELNNNLDKHHHHIFCASCGSIIDFEIDEKIERDLEKEINKIELKNSISVLSHSLELLSICKKCNKKNIKSNR